MKNIVPMMFDYRSRLSEIADAYASAPMLDTGAIGHWQALAIHSVAKAQRIRDILHVVETGDAEPYPDHESMFADIRARRFMVSTANSEHPLWSQRTNVAFRIVHDVLGHYVARLQWRADAGFDWPGEVSACAAHFAMLQRERPYAMAALFTECLGQTGFAIEPGGFGPQKVATLPIGV